MVESADIIEDALVITSFDSDDLRLDDYRRLTGPGLLWDHPGAILDVFYSTIDTEMLLKTWQKHLERTLTAIGWEKELNIVRQFDGGVNLAISAPMDQLYSAMFAMQTAWHHCSAELGSHTPISFDSMIIDLKAIMKREENPDLLELMETANRKNVDVLTDDDLISIGHGYGSQSWDVLGQLPKPDQVDWDNLRDIPVAMITGTNGKTTTTRLSSAIGKAAGLVSGITSTDFVKVGDDILDRGDYSGPGGGRMLLRDKRLEIAYLEVARGGILRRGLPLRQARAALVTNVAADHLGQYGVNTVEELAVAKFAVHRTLAKDGVLVLNADDSYVVNEAKNTNATICWFSLCPTAPQILAALSDKQPCAWLDNTSLVYFDGVKTESIADVNDIPITLNGAAQYNVRNALGALCLSKAMGLNNAAIRLGLSEFQNDPKDNPGRCNEFKVNGTRVFVDFAHNPHSIAAVTETMAAIPAKRRFLLLGHAGDRSDQDIRDVTESAMTLKPDVIVATETPEYLRGREVGEVTQLILEKCKDLGIAEDQILTSVDPVDGVTQIVEHLKEGDLALLLVLSQRDQIFDLLRNS